jgi:integrase
LVKINCSNNNGSIRIRFDFEGKKHNIAGLGSWANRLDRAKAELLAATIERDILLGNFDATLDRYLRPMAVSKPVEPAKVPAPKSHTLLKVWDSWVATLDLSEQTKAEHYSTVRRHILRTKPAPLLGSTAWLIESTVHLSAYSFNLRLRMLGNCLDWAIDAGLTQSNPFRKIKRKKSPRINKTRPLTLEQVRQVLNGFNAIAPTYRPFAEFLFSTGVRTSEGVGLQWKRIDLEAGTVTIADTLTQMKYQTTKVRKPTKTSSVTTLPMSTNLRKLLESLPRGEPDDLIFTHNGKPISRQLYHRAWTKVLVDVGIPHQKPYSSRHTFCSQALDMGLTPSQVAEFLGHSNSSMVERNYGSAINVVPLPNFDI